MPRRRYLNTYLLVIYILLYYIRLEDPSVVKLAQDFSLNKIVTVVLTQNFFMLVICLK